MTPSRRAPAKAAASVARRAEKAAPTKANAKKTAKASGQAQRSAAKAPAAKSAAAKAGGVASTPAKGAAAKAGGAASTPAKSAAPPTKSTGTKSTDGKSPDAKGAGTKGTAKAPATSKGQGVDAAAGKGQAGKAPAASQQARGSSADAPARRPSRALGAPRQDTAESRPPGAGPYATDTKFLHEQRKRLLEERTVYQRQAEDLRAEADSLALEREPGDVQFDEESGEGGTIAVDRERDLTLSAQALAAIEEIDLALREIDAGTYGACERCGKPIAKERLRALPYARLDVACKSGGVHRR